MINDLKIDLEDHKKRLKELQDKTFIKELNDRLGQESILPIYLIPVYKKIIKSIEDELKEKDK